MRTAIGFLVAGTLLCIVAGLTTASTFRVPSEYPTIQSGLDMVSEGDTVLVAPGTYTGIGNHFLWPPPVDFVLRSEGGPEVTILDCAQSGGEEDGILLWDAYTRATVIEGLSFVHSAGTWWGAGIVIKNASPTIRNCVSSWNYAPWNVSGVCGGIFCCQSSALIVNCTTTGNSSAENSEGSGIWIGCYSNVTVANTVCWGNCDRDIYVEQQSTATLVCCVYGDLDVDGQVTIENCMQASPLFCNASSCSGAPYDPSRLRVQPLSPCLPANNPCGVLIGALGGGCPPASAPEIRSPGLGGSRLWASISPNPTRGLFDCTLRGGRPPYRLELFDASGRVVCSRSDAGSGAASGVSMSDRITWDIAAGDCRVPSGVYRLRVTSAQGQAVRSILVVR